MDRKLNLSGMRAISFDSIRDYKEICNECDVEQGLNACNKCGNSVCKQKKCSWIFPHKYNSTFVICNGCFKDIDYKLLNYDHLLIYKFLKKNMRKRRVSC